MTTPAPPHEVSTVDLLVVLTRVETKLDATAASLADHEQRIRGLEQRIPPELATDVAALKRRQWPLPTIGAGSGLIAVITAIWPHLGH